MSDDEMESMDDEEMEGEDDGAGSNGGMDGPEMDGGMDDVTSDDKLWAALAYVFTPIVPIILLLLEDKKDRPFIRAHNMQALLWGIIFYILVSFHPVVGC